LNPWPTQPNHIKKDDAPNGIHLLPVRTTLELSMCKIGTKDTKLGARNVLWRRNVIAKKSESLKRIARSSWFISMCKSKTVSQLIIDLSNIQNTRVIISENAFLPNFHICHFFRWQTRIRRYLKSSRCN